MEKIDEGGPAFPINSYHESQRGLTKREWFAGMAMQGIFHCIKLNGRNDEPKAIAEMSVKMADALIDELKKVKK